MFHSALASAGPVRVTVDDNPRWLAKKERYVVDLTILDNTAPPAEVCYWAENQQCGEFFKGQKGKTFTIVASGGGKGREDTAAITYVGQSGQTVPPPQAVPATNQPASTAGAPVTAHAPAGAKANVNELAALKQAKRFIGRNESLVKIALKRAVAVKAEFEALYGAVLPTELFHSVFASLLYGAGGAGIADGLPACIDLLSLGQPVTATVPAQVATPAPPPPPKPKCPSCDHELDPGGRCLNTECKTNDDVPF